MSGRPVSQSVNTSKMVNKQKTKHLLNTTASLSFIITFPGALRNIIIIGSTLRLLPINKTENIFSLIKIKNNKINIFSPKRRRIDGLLGQFRLLACLDSRR